LKKFFENIITFKKKLNDHFENSARHKTRAITVLNTRETRITMKLSMDMASPPWKHSSSPNFLLKHGRGFWQPRGTPEGGNRHEK
jgi:hypothetical protein